MTVQQLQAARKLSQAEVDRRTRDHDRAAGPIIPRHSAGSRV